MKDREGYHVWSCSGCTAAYKQLSDACATNTRSIRDLTATVETLAATVRATEAAITAANNRMDKLSEDMVKMKAEKENVVKKTESNIYREMNEIKARKKNLVFHGIPEANFDLDAKNRKEKDTNELSEVLTEIDITIDTNDEIKACIRLGRRNEDQEKPRPLLIVFNKEETRDKIFSNARKLANSPFNDISIVPDLTTKQRAEEAAMRKEAKKLNESMDDETAKNWVYRCVGPRGEQRLEKVKLRPENQDLARRGSTRPTLAQRKKDQRAATDQREETTEEGATPTPNRH